MGDAERAQMRISMLSCALATASLIACGGSVGEGTAADVGPLSDAVAEVGADARADGDSVDARPDGPADDALVGPRCPATMPAAGAPCREKIDCDYGSDPRPGCRQDFWCDGAHFVYRSVVCDAPKPAVDCPAESVAVAHGTCTVAGSFCSYPDRTCECVAFSSSPTQLYCDSPAIASGCPVKLPNAGTACTGDMHCVYGTCGNDSAGGARCDGGIWMTEPPPCGV